MSEQLEQATILMQDSAVKPTTAFVDLGYRGVDADNPDVHIVHRGKSKRISEQERQLLKRRQAIEPIIGHIKSDNRMERCHLKGEIGDRLHAALFLRLCQVTALWPNWAHIRQNLAINEIRAQAQRLVVG